ncbi:hypothetical protein ACIA5G_51195 [Amycolatopsis sp. NPDC051758]|uniref:hypothetical protein n=1 Tax=Amycolatopsis sp. NPDC051758 TaxID=3363935 RepID=UPI00379A7F05
MKFTIDGLDVHTEPITLAQLYCGCEKFFLGHDVYVDGLALCPNPDTCTGHQDGVTAVEDFVHTFVAGSRGVRREADQVA